MKIVEVKEDLPGIKRNGGRGQSEEVKDLIAKLKTGKVFKIDGVEAGNVYNALQQRIRSAAGTVKHANGSRALKAQIRYIQDTQELYFQGTEVAETV